MMKQNKLEIYQGVEENDGTINVGISSNCPIHGPDNMTGSRGSLKLPGALTLNRDNLLGSSHVHLGMTVRSQTSGIQNPLYE